MQETGDLVALESRLDEIGIARPEIDMGRFVWLKCRHLRSRQMFPTRKP
jgi:hypothetical protein